MNITLDLLALSIIVEIILLLLGICIYLIIKMKKMNNKIVMFDNQKNAVIDEINQLLHISNTNTENSPFQQWLVNALTAMRNDVPIAALWKCLLTEKNQPDNPENNAEIQKEIQQLTQQLEKQKQMLTSMRQYKKLYSIVIDKCASLRELNQTIKNALISSVDQNLDKKEIESSLNNLDLCEQQLISIEKEHTQLPSFEQLDQDSTPSHKTRLMEKKLTVASQHYEALFTMYKKLRKAYQNIKSTSQEEQKKQQQIVNEITEKNIMAEQTLLNKKTDCKNLKDQIQGIKRLHGSEDNQEFINFNSEINNLQHNLRLLRIENTQLIPYKKMFNNMKTQFDTLKKIQTNLKSKLNTLLPKVAENQDLKSAIAELERNNKEFQICIQILEDTNLEIKKELKKNQPVMKHDELSTSSNDNTTAETSQNDDQKKFKEIIKQKERQYLLLQEDYKILENEYKSLYEHITNR